MFSHFIHAEFGCWLVGRQAASPLDLLDLLLEAGAEVNHARACDGNTALHLCAMRGFAAGVRLLLRHQSRDDGDGKQGGGADRTLLNKAAQTALFLAGNEETRRALLEY